jgi:farnesyl-diphosphate farnesyltransferase
MQTDWELCAESLRRVSRTFSRPIEVLNDDLRRSVTCGYLLCRIVDTIEDNPRFTVGERDDRYRAFHDVLRRTTDGSVFERSWETVQGSPPHELELCAQIRRVMAVLDTVPEEMQSAVLRWVAEMARGMQIYSHRSPDSDGVVAPATSDDLERYCYFVAGTVGNMLTELFALEMKLEDEDPVVHRMHTHAEAFGAGLQLVNILKDIGDDMERGRSFVPRTLCQTEGLRNQQLIDPSRRGDAHRAVGPLFELARMNLDRALSYALAVPPAHREIRLFCLLPLWLAVRTVGLAYGNDAMFTSNQPVKVSRQEVETVIEHCVRAYGDDALLRADYEAMWSPVARLMVADSSTEGWSSGLDAA